MNIQSNFGDYYDGCTYMCGEDVFYKRIINNRKLEGGTKNEWGHYTHKHYTEDTQLLTDLRAIFNKYINIADCAVLIIGEKVYPFIMRTVFDKVVPSTHRYGIDVTVYKFPVELVGTKPKEVQHLTANYNDLYSAVRKLDQSPIVLFSNYTDQDEQPPGQEMTGKVILNPQLKRVGLSNFVPSHEVIQELELYINKLNTNEQIITLSDKLKIGNAGFDNKSFRRN